MEIKHCTSARTEIKTGIHSKCVNEVDTEFFQVIMNTLACSDLTDIEKNEISKHCDLSVKLSLHTDDVTSGVSQPLLNVLLEIKNNDQPNSLTDENNTWKKTKLKEEEELTDNEKFIFPQWFAGIAVALLVMQPGLMGGWCSPTLAKLMSPTSPIPINPQEASWVAALVNLGRLFGSVMGPMLATFIGSKSTITWTLWPLAFGWLLICMADSVHWLYGARIFLGLGLGMAFSAFPLYIGEISIPKIRGALISLATLGAPVGQLISSICGSYLSISMAASIYLTLALLLMFLFFWFPNSPHHLVKTGNCIGARRAISWYRAGIEVDKELDAVSQFVTGNGQKSFMNKLKEFKTPAIRRATFQIMALFTLNQICGLNSVLFYMETILKNAKSLIITPSLAVIYVNLCGIIAAMISIILIDRCGRRFLLIASSAGATISMLALSGHFLMIDMSRDITDFQWLPIASMLLFIISFFAGLFPVPNAILSETFPANIRSIAAIIGSVTGAVASFFAAKMYQPMVDYMGETYVFLTYAISASIVIPYTLIAITETKGKSLQQIQDELIKK